MSVAIKNALINLDRVVDKMEAAVVKQKKSQKPSNQSDLFAPAAKGQSTGSVLNFDRNALAKKLDMTIAKVEQLLGEG